ncbi:hypothetical protein [Tessaracoccus sp. Z1128]
MSEHSTPGPTDEAVIDDTELTQRPTEGPDEGEHLHASDHSIAEEDIEADISHQEADPRQL